MRRVALACACLAIAACDPDAPEALSRVDAGRGAASDLGQPDAASPPPPLGPAGPLDLGMGDVRVGDVAVASVWLRNDGPARLHRVTTPAPCPHDGPFCVRSRTATVATDARFTFEVEYRPTPSLVGERERADLEIQRGDDAPWSIVVDGRGTEAWPVRCFLPPGQPQAPDGCAEVAVRCINQGRRPLWLTELEVETDGATRWLDDPPNPARPTRLGEAAAIFDLELCPRGNAPLEARLRWVAQAEPGGPTTAGASNAITIRPARPQLVAPDVVVIPVASGVAPLRLENRGAAPLILWDFEIDEPFDPNPDFWSGGVVPNRARLEPGEALEIFVHYDFDNLPDDAPVQGQLRLRASDRAGPVVVELRTAPAEPPPCALRLPADLDLGTIGPPRQVLPDRGRHRHTSHAFVIPVENIGDQPCWVSAEVSGFLAEVFRYPRPPPSSSPAYTQASVSFFVPPGAVQRLRVEPRTDLAPGRHSGAVRFTARGLSEPGPAVGVRAEVRADGALVRVGIGSTNPDPTCGVFDRFTVTVDEAEVRSAALSGALAPFARLSTDGALPAAGPVTLTVDPVAGRPGGGTLRLDVETSAGALTVPLAFGGDAPSKRVEHFGADERGVVDVVLLIDDSASMAPRRELVSVSWADLLEYLQAQGLDYRLFLATTTDPTRPVSLNGSEPPYVDPTSPERFAERMNAIRFDGSGREYVADAVLAAVEAAAPHLRPEAVLTVIATTDEGEASATSEADAQAMLPAAKPTWPDDWVTFSAVSGGAEGCAEPGADGELAEPAPRLARWADAKGGVDTSICWAGFSRYFERRGSGGWVPTLRVFLREPPHFGSLAVFVEEAPLPARDPSGRLNWTFDLSTHAIRFLPLAIPRPGAEVRVEYETCR